MSTASVVGVGHASKVTDGIWLRVTPPATAVIVFVPMVDDVSMLVSTPLASVLPLAGVNVVPPPVALNVTFTPLARLPLASLTVTVAVEAAVPLEITCVAGDAVTVEFAALAAPGTT